MVQQQGLPASHQLRQWLLTPTEPRVNHSCLAYRHPSNSVSSPAPSEAYGCAPHRPAASPGALQRAPSRGTACLQGSAGPRGAGAAVLVPPQQHRSCAADLRVSLASPSGTWSCRSMGKSSFVSNRNMDSSLQWIFSSCLC